MTDRRETAIAQVKTLLDTLATAAGPTVTRAEVLPDEIPAGGLVNLAEGEPEEVEETLGIVTRHWAERLEIELLVQASTGEARATALAALAAQVATALDIDPDAGGDPTLGGVVDYARLGQLAGVDDLRIPGAEGIKAAVLPLDLDYTTGRNPMEAI